MATKRLQHIRGTLAKIITYVLADGELAVDKTNHKLVVGDSGTTDGYFVCANDSDLATTNTNVTTLSSTVSTLNSSVSNIQADYMKTASGNTITANAVAVSNSDGKLTAVTGTSGQVIAFNSSGVPVATTISTGGVQKYSTTIGDGSSTTYTVTHNLNTTKICVNAIQVSTNQNVWISYTISSANAITLTFSSAVASNSIGIIIMG